MQQLTPKIHLPIPLIQFDAEARKISISGRSLSSEPDTIFVPLKKLIEAYLEHQETLCCEINLEYFNSSSARSILHLSKELERQATKGRQITLRWLYEIGDEDSKEFAQDLQNLLSLKIELLQLNPDPPVTGVAG